MLTVDIPDVRDTSGFTGYLIHTVTTDSFVSLKIAVISVNNAHSYFLIHSSRQTQRWGGDVAVGDVSAPLWPMLE